MSTSCTFSNVKNGALAALAGAAIVAVFSACDLPFNLSQPTTRALESGATDGLTSATSFEITGSYTDKSAALSTTASVARGSTSTAIPWTIDLQESGPDTKHVVISTATVKLEAIILAGTGYFRGHDFLALHMGTDPLSQNLVKAAGSSWWKGSVGLAPRLPDLTYGVSFRATFLGTAVTQRSDHVSVNGLDAVDLSGARADVYIASTPPYRLLRVHFKAGVTVDGVSDADLRFSNYNKDFAIAAPTDVIDFSNLSTLTPIYTVVSVDTSACGSTCAVSAQLKNLGGIRPAKAPSTITFTMTDPASGRTLGSCQAQVRPDVGFNSTTTVGCTIGGLSGPPANATVVTATADNPGQT